MSTFQHQLAGKFLLKNLSSQDHYIYNTFLGIYYSWRYVVRSLPILTSTAYSLISIHNCVISSNILPVCELNFQALLLYLLILIDRNFFKYSPTSLKTLSSIAVNSFFLDYIVNIFSFHTLIFTDGSVYPLSTDYVFHIPKLHISFSNNLPPTVSSFAAECFAIFEVLQLISTLAPNNFLIASDSLSYLQALANDVFKSHPSPLHLKIRKILFNLAQSGFDIQFLWVAIP